MQWALGAVSTLERSNPGSTAIGTSTHHGKSTPSTNHRIASCITQEQPALRCARSIKAAYARACSRRTATITHDTTKTFLHISTFYTPAYITKTLSSGPASSCNTRTQTHQHYQDGPQTLGTQESMEQPLVTCTNRCRNELSRTHPSSHL